MSGENPDTQTADLARKLISRGLLKLSEPTRLVPRRVCAERVLQQTEIELSRATPRAALWGSGLVADTAAAVCTRDERAGWPLPCRMRGAGAVVSLPLKGATEAMASRFRREHARIQSHQHTKTKPKTFQQRQTEQRLSDDKNRAVVEDMASRFSCSSGVANDFAGQCEERMTDLDFDLICSEIALGFWVDPPDAARPVVDALRELEAERRRHLAAITQLRERLLALAKGAAAHQHLALPIEHYQGLVRDRLFPGSQAAASPEFRGFR